MSQAQLDIIQQLSKKLDLKEQEPDQPKKEEKDKEAMIMEHLMNNNTREMLKLLTGKEPEGGQLLDAYIALQLYERQEAAEKARKESKLVPQQQQRVGLLERPPPKYEGPQQPIQQVSAEELAMIHYEQQQQHQHQQRMQPKPAEQPP